MSVIVEDAVVLARAVASEPAVDAALVAYERDRRARTAKLVKMAAANRDAKTAGPVARRVQSAVMPLALRVFYERSTAWLYDHDLPPLPQAPSEDARRGA
jgi:2-polyprenyl-6-methoxyphenol hydroxylase-like FAD-dependent oxidoreductase